MAIQIQGNTVITDSRDFQNLTTLNGFFIGVQTPSITSPADAATDQNKTVTITSSAFGAGIISETHVSSDWELATDSGFGTIVQSNLANTTNKTSWTTGDLDVSTTYYARVRYNGTRTTSQYANTVSFTTKAAFAPTVLGQSYEGGFYTGTINVSGVGCYYLIVAPNATGCTICMWKNTRSLTPGTTSCIDGYSNTYGPLNNATHPAGNWTATRTIGGFNDWYLPARDELNLMYTNKGCMPAGEEFGTPGGQLGYCSSTQRDADTACQINFTTGVINFNYKYTFNFYNVRAVRRDPI